jgi:hypothetical protein
MSDKTYKKGSFSSPRIFSSYLRDVLCGLFLILAFQFVLAPHPAVAEGPWWNDRWQIMVFAGGLSTNEFLSEIILGGTLEFEDSAVSGVSVSKRLFDLGDYVGIEAEGQAIKHFGAQNHWEFTAFFLARWLVFPWDDYVDTTLAIGDGVSHATEVPALEKRAFGEDESTKTLNYIVGELTFRLPEVSRWELSLRFQHRSGVFRRIDNVQESSTNFVLGLKFSL